jgi:hypothetical protein
LTPSGLWFSRDALISTENRGFGASAPASLFLDALYDPCLVTGRFLVLPHVGRRMSTVTTWSKQCASSGSMANSSGTRYPPQSTWSSAMPHVRRLVNHWLSIPSVANHLRSGQRARCLPLEGVNPGDFEADDSNTGRDGRVALYHRLEPWGLIFFLPLSLLWPQALLRTSLGVDFLITMLGHGHDPAAQCMGSGALGPLSPGSRLSGAHSSCDHACAMRSW